MNQNTSILSILIEILLNIFPSLEYTRMVEENEIEAVVDLFDSYDTAYEVNELNNLLKRKGINQKDLIMECINLGVLEVDRMAYAKRFVEMWVALGEYGLDVWMQQHGME